MIEQEFPNIYKMTFPEHAAVVMRLNLPYTAYIDERKHIAAETWCKETFGSRWSIASTAGKGGVWACRQGGVGHHWQYLFGFAEEKYRTWFELRWV